MDAIVDPPAGDAGRRNRRLRVPTGVLVTLLVTTLSVLVFPAATRQWDDRQKARELKAALVEEIAASSGRVIAEAVTRLDGNESIFPLVGEYYAVFFRINAKLRAYFPDPIVREWLLYQNEIRSWLLRADAERTAAKGRNTDAIMRIQTETARLSDLTNTLTGRILAAEPKGFSTTRGDLLRDLIPGI